LDPIISIFVLNYEKECEQQVLDANNVGAFCRFANKRLNNKTGMGFLYNAHDDEVVVSDIDRAKVTC